MMLLSLSYIANYSIKEPWPNHDGNKKVLLSPEKKFCLQEIQLLYISFMVHFKNIKLQWYY